MPEPLESEPAGVTLESNALPQEDFPPGDVRRRPEAPGNPYAEDTIFRHNSETQNTCTTFKLIIP
jgi:hypothetical protein